MNRIKRFDACEKKSIGYSSRLCYRLSLAVWVIGNQTADQTENHISNAENHMPKVELLTLNGQVIRGLVQVSQFGARVLLVYFKNVAVPHDFYIVF